MKTVTIVYEITDAEAFKKVSAFGLEHHGLKSFAVGQGNVMDHAEALEGQLVDLGAVPIQPVEQFHQSQMDYNDIDELSYSDAVNLVRAEERCTFSLLQRKLRIGFNRAIRICELMIERGVVSAPVEGGFDYPILPDGK